MNPHASRRSLAVALNLIGVGFVSYDLIRGSYREDPRSVTVVGLLACAGWLVAALLPNQEGRARTVLTIGVIAGGSLIASATETTGFIPAIFGIVTLTAQPVHSRRLVGVTVVGSALLLTVGWVTASGSTANLVSGVSTLAASVLGGLSRRQYRAAEDQSRALLEERLAVEQERALVAALSERSRIARDLHDVLAHSLGGLVIQLEAVDALLESGRDAAARERVVAARQLAVSGLDEAKRAVSTLREPADGPETVVADLTATHRSLGGDVTVLHRGEPGPLTPECRTAFRRAVQELLTNARRHALGASTTLALDWSEDALTVTASTPWMPGGGPRDRVGGGHGLVGMRERVEAVGGSMTVRAGPSFVVSLRLPQGAGIPQLPRDGGST